MVHQLQLVENEGFIFNSLITLHKLGGFIPKTM